MREANFAESPLRYGALRFELAVIYKGADAGLNGVEIFAAGAR